MTIPSKSKIRQAILANRGGHQETSDAGIMTIWNSLNPETQQKYIQSLSTAAASQADETKTAGPAAASQAEKKKGKEDAVSDTSRRDL